ncbi:MAG: phosphoribosylanthranilate isomerase [Desulfobulbaceae bacterium]|nr:phosphoribosylanthranilate isomerase [Desulfobulbaceae bacterium]
MNTIVRIRIKMCGVTRLQDAMVAAGAGVDALGFIFYEKSPRYIDPEEARLIIEELPPFVDTVGVFVDKKRKEVEEIIRYCRLGYAQLHGEEGPKYCERLVRLAAPCQVLKAIRVGGHCKAEDIALYNEHVKGFLLDTFKKDKLGGTGDIFDWKLIKRFNLQKPFLLAGGLDNGNILEALEGVRPYGVDVNSGVETAPGVKDYDLIRNFIRTVRNFEREMSTGNNQRVGKA